MKKLITLLSMFLSINHLHAQDSSAVKTDSAETKIARNTVFLEALGSGGVYSINYDRIFYYKNRTKVTLRGGFSFIPKSQWGDLSSAWTVPMEMNLLIGKKHHLEWGLGLAYYYGGWSYTDYNNANNIFISKSLWFIPRIIGYRFQKPQRGLFIKADILGRFHIYEFNKQFDSDQYPKAVPGYGLGIGYTFKNKK